MNPPPSRLPSRDDASADFWKAPVPRSVPPRVYRAAMKQVSASAGVAFGVIFGLMGCFFVALMFPWGFWNDLRLAAASAPTTEGRIISAEPTNLSINETKVWSYSFEYRESAAAPPLYAESFTTGRHWDPGNAVRVAFLPDSSHAVIIGARTTRGDKWMALLLLFPLIGFALVYFTLRKRRRVAAILTHGRALTARIADVKKTNVQINYQSVYQVSLQTSDAAAPVDLTLRCHAPDLVLFAEAKLAAGAPITVLFDPRYPKLLILPEAL